jgi:hypothetical protein
MQSRCAAVVRRLHALLWLNCEGTYVRRSRTGHSRIAQCACMPLPVSCCATALLPSLVTAFSALLLCYIQADTVIFDDELSPGQLRNLEKAFSGGREGAQVCVGR